MRGTRCRRVNGTKMKKLQCKAIDGFPLSERAQPDRGSVFEPTAAPANNSIAVETALSEQNNNTLENDATVQTSEKPYETQGETPNDGEAPDNGETPTEQKTGFFYDETTQNWFL